MGYYVRHSRKSDKWFALGFGAFFVVTVGLGIYFADEYSEENIRKEQEKNRIYIWEQNIDTTAIRDTLNSKKDSIENKLR